MTVAHWLAKSVNKLDSANIASPKLDAEILLKDLLKKDRTWIHAHPEHKISENDARLLNAQLERRLKHEPLAYIRGYQEFYGRDFEVSPDTLTPRPETETLVELALVEARNIKTKNKLNIIDFGTGSGCIVISIALELPKLNANFRGLDVSEQAINIAKQNAHNLKANVEFELFDLLSEEYSFTESNIILANLPYVPNDYEINLSASHEPGFAIFGGKDGLDYYRLLFKQINNSSNNSFVILTESLPPQHEALEQIARDFGFGLTKTQDLIQVFKST